ncbi:hypothetical protein KAR91_26805 [Candidatus Pacearchaeota archaeon]|nr:hypothetical protein [Candidatus Pacearchaeota archaeon]
MASMGIGSMNRGMGRCISDRLYVDRKPCPSKEVAEEIDRDILREIVEDTEEVYEDTTATASVDESRCVEDTYPVPPPIPQEESRTVRRKVPRGIGRSIYGDSSNARATLEDWDMHGIRLAGRIYEDKRGQYPDGKMIYTDTVKTAISELKEGAIVRTRNNYYLLGKRHVPNDE